VEFGLARIEGTGVSSFYVIPRWRFEQLPGASNAARIAAMQAGSFYGPRSPGEDLPVEVGEAYYLFPVCGGSVIWRGDPPRTFSANAITPVHLRCP
jgi:hypothetical protein